LQLARTPKGRAFTAASTAACLIRSGEPIRSELVQCRILNRWFLPIFAPLLTARTTHPDLKRELLSIAEAYEHRAKLAREKALTRKRVGKNR
jgi:hypothetical protein